MVFPLKVFFFKKKFIYLKSRVAKRKREYADVASLSRRLQGPKGYRGQDRNLALQPSFSQKWQVLGSPTAGPRRELDQKWGIQYSSQYPHEMQYHRQ